MELVHLQIHPSLQTGFGLQTNMDMDGQMDMVNNLMTLN